MFSSRERDLKQTNAQRMVFQKGGCMNDFAKGIIVVAILLYIVSPIDAMPGPIDDLIVLLLGIAAQRKN